MPTNPTGTRRILMLALMGGFAAGSASAQPGDPSVPPWLRGRIGVYVQPLTEELREHFGAPPDRGVLVARVEPGRPGQRGGLLVGDVLLDANDAFVLCDFDHARKRNTFISPNYGTPRTLLPSIGYKERERARAP